METNLEDHTCICDLLICLA